ncbi:MAG: hypothetical protein ACR2RE_09000 [Geminicoccaceae bacterium]
MKICIYGASVIGGIATPTIDIVLSLVRRLVRSQGIYRTFPESAPETQQVA